MYKDNLQYGNIKDAFLVSATAFDRPKKITVTQAAEQFLYVKELGGMNSFYTPKLTPYMKLPADLLASRLYNTVCVVGSARSGKTLSLIGGLLAYAVTSDPGHMLIVSMTKEMAEKLSKQTISPWINNSPEISKHLGRKTSDDNVLMKMFTNGMALTVTHPSPSALASLGYRYVCLTDFDRYINNQEGNIFSQGRKRTQSYLSRGCTLVESSPGVPISDPSWQPSRKHEAPGVDGILSIYNQSDRRRWYWMCLHCGEYFQVTPDVSLFRLMPDYDSLLDIVKTETNLDKYAESISKVICEHCGGIHEEKDKLELNTRGVWLGENQWCENGVIYGDEIKSTIAGFWISGLVSPFQQWEAILKNYLAGLKTYMQTGSEESFMTACNVDIGMVYTPRALLEYGNANLSEKVQDFDRYYVPDEARLLLASVDVQSGKLGRFIVQVHAIGVGLEQWVIDRFSIEYTDDGGRRLDPTSVVEDWDVLFDKVINASYRTSDGRKMMIHMTAIDTGGAGDTTAMSFQFQKRCAARKLHHKVKLIKGSSNKMQDPLKSSFGLSDNKRKMLDCPFMLVDTSYFKDILSALLRKKDLTPPCYHFPRWLPKDFFEELQAEVKDSKTGKWIKMKSRNESIDLSVYIMALCWHLKLNDEKFNWDKPWCAPLVSNINVVSPEYARTEREVKQEKKPVIKNNLYSSEWGSRL